MSSSKHDGSHAVVSAVRDAIPVPALTYQPTDTQREVKAKFWLAFKDNPLCETDAVNPAVIEQLTGVDVQAWSRDKRFWAWFTIKDQVRLNLEIAAERASEMAMMMLDPAHPMNDNARVQLVKYVLEFAGRTPPSRKEIKWADKEVGDMSPEELKALIDKLTAKQLTPSQD